MPSKCFIRSLCIGLLASLPAVAQSPAEPETSAPIADKIPVEVYQAPRAIKIDKPDYPIGELLEGGEGWVNVGFMVGANGKPFEVAVLKSTGNKIFEDAAVKAIENSTFNPALSNGQPVESVAAEKFVFRDPSLGAGAHPGFVAAYSSVLKAIAAGDQAAADSAMKKLIIKNLYEDAYYGLATYNYARKWGDDWQQLEGLRRAIAGEDRAGFLADKLFNYALRACLQLELQTHEYGEAVVTWNRLQKSGVEAKVAAQIKNTMDKVQQLRSNDQSFDVAGTIADGGWNLILFKRNFRITVSNGYISGIKLKCDKHFVHFDFDPQLQYQVASKYGNCRIELEGAPDTRFTFTQS